MAVFLPDFAKRCAKQRMDIFPIHSLTEDGCSCGNPTCTQIAKHPRNAFGVIEATSDLDQIREWWTVWPDANIGVRMDTSNLVGIDIDLYKGGRVEDLPLTEAERVTPTVHSGGGGLHYYFRARPGLVVSSSNKYMPAGIDVRGWRGFLIAPPSLHASGRRYEWAANRAPWEVPFHPLPDSLLPFLKPKEETIQRIKPDIPKIDTASFETLHPYVRAALNKELDVVASAPEGDRNNSVNRAAFNLGQFIQAGLLPRVEVEQLLYQAATTIGLGHSESVKTIASGLNAGIRNPRRHWPDLI